MKRNKRYVLAALSTIAILGSVSAVGAATVSASSTESEYPPIIEKLAEKLGLDQNQVQAAFDEVRQEQKEARLDEAVEDGDITEDQKDQILAKQDEMQTAIDEINDQELTADARREAIQTIREDVRNWADENDIPTYLIGIGGSDGIGGPGGMGMGMRRGGDFGIDM